MLLEEHGVELGLGLGEFLGGVAQLALLERQLPLDKFIVLDELPVLLLENGLDFFQLSQSDAVGLVLLCLFL